MHFSYHYPTAILALAATTLAVPAPLSRRVAEPEPQAGIARPKLGSIPYGADIYSCATPGTVALTFDDGPWIYTSELLDLLNQYNAKATFFVR
jgi:peptidoglycan/xylan/chitin deacetylase (PgdA/CDA1 family)